VPFYFAVFVAGNVVHHIYKLGFGDFQTRLLLDFANNRLHRGFAKLHQAARNTPLALSRLAPTLFQQYFTITNYYGANTHNRLAWIKTLNHALKPPSF